MTAIAVQCPCGVEVAVELNVSLPFGEDGLQRVEIDPDLTDLWAHHFTHDEGEEGA